MSCISSIITPLVEEFILYRKASDCWNKSYESNLFYFVSYCSKEYPNAKALSQQMFDKWCAKHDTENNNSCRSRIYVVISFIRFIKIRHNAKIEVPIIPDALGRTYIPHAFTNQELLNFFEACDNITSETTIVHKSRKITIPVFFRLLYSSGIRTIEARMLRLEDVNLNDGILNIRLSKGHDQHFVVLHDSMLGLMKAFNSVIDKIYPNRFYFFPAHNGKYHPQSWVSRNFGELWNQKNTSYAVAYDLRHHYAIENINRWIGVGMEFHSKFIYLSKSMGHSVLEATKYYYSLTPGFADILIDKTNTSFNNIIPEVK